MKILINDIPTDKYKDKYFAFGHGYCLGMELLNITGQIIED
jgi:hypothetical protein